MGQLLRAISKNGGVACYVAQTTDVVARAEQIHTTSAVVTAALGRLLTAASIMGSTLKSEEAQLRVQYELAYDLSAIEEAVTADGSMIRPEDSQIVYVDLSAPDSVELFNEESPMTGVMGLVESAKDIFREVVEYFR